MEVDLSGPSPLRRCIPAHRVQVQIMEIDGIHISSLGVQVLTIASAISYAYR